jgi:hypothetical protein
MHNLSAIAFLSPGIPGKPLLLRRLRPNALAFKKKFQARPDLNKLNIRVSARAIYEAVCQLLPPLLKTRYGESRELFMFEAFLNSSHRENLFEKKRRTSVFVERSWSMYRVLIHVNRVQGSSHINPAGQSGNGVEVS